MCLFQISVPDADKTDSWFNRMTIGKLMKDAPGVRKILLSLLSMPLK